MDITCGKACTVRLWEIGVGLWLEMLCHCVSLSRSRMFHEREVRVLIIIGVSTVVDNKFGITY